MLISKTKKVFIITFNAPNKEREKLIFCVRFLMRYCENAETEAPFIIHRKVSNNNYFLFLILRSITICLNIIQCVSNGASLLIRSKTDNCIADPANPSTP